jgi:hypothetical protein
MGRDGAYVFWGDDSSYTNWKGSRITTEITECAGHWTGNA